MKTIWFDMDGTVYELYKLDGWLTRLEEKDATVYNAKNACRANLKRIDSAVKTLVEAGWEVGVITWGAKGHEEGSAFLKEIAHAKKMWLRANMPNLFFYGHFTIQPYGVDKVRAIREVSDTMNVLVDDNALVRKVWRAHGKNFKTINAKVSYAKALENLAKGVIE